MNTDPKQTELRKQERNKKKMKNIFLLINFSDGPLHYLYMLEILKRNLIFLFTPLMRIRIQR